MWKQFVGCLYLLFVKVIGNLSAHECNLFCCQGERVTFIQTCEKFSEYSYSFYWYTKESMMISRFSGLLKPKYKISDACFRETNKYSTDVQFDHFPHTFEDCNFDVIELEIKGKKNMEFRLNEIVATFTKLRVLKVIIIDFDFNKWNLNLNSVSLSVQ